MDDCFIVEWSLLFLNCLDGFYLLLIYNKFYITGLYFVLIPKYSATISNIAFYYAILYQIF
jgi:hypothetical protein